MAVTLYTDSAVGIWARESPLSELSACLHALAAAEHHPVSRPWVTRVHDVAEPNLLGRVLEYSPLWGALRPRYLLPLSPTVSSGFSGELSAVRDLPIEEFARQTAQALRTQSSFTGREPEDVLASTGRDRFLDGLRRMSWQRYDLGRRLLEDPSAFREDVLELMDELFSTVFEEEWAGLEGPLRQAARERCHQYDRRGVDILGDFLEAQLRDDPPRVVLDKLYSASADLAKVACVLVPSVHVSPHLVIKHLSGWPVVIQYPVGNDPATSTGELVQRRLAVLNDHGRLVICRYLLRRPMAGVELAHVLGMTQPQVSRHLRKLREVGLVHGHREGAVVRYALDSEVVRRLGVDLLLSLYR